MISIGYSRSSRDDGEDTFSIDSQEKRIQEYAAKHRIPIADDYMFSDEFSGFTLDRPDFNKIMRLIEAGQVQHMVVYKVNRIARKSHLADYFLQEIALAHGVQLHIVEWGKPVQNKKDDLLLFGLQAQFGQFDAMDIKERTMRGRREKAEQGIWLGQGAMVYGYRKEGTRKNTAVYPIEEEARIIRLIFHLFVEESTPTTDIMRFLNAQGVASPSHARGLWQKSQWRLTSVLRILRDTRYIGIWYSFRHDSDGKKLRPKEEWIKHEFPNLAIVDKETFDRAQAILDRRRESHTFLQLHDYLFSRRLSCVCKHSMSTTTNFLKSGKLQYYQCNHRRRYADSICTLRSVRVDFIDEQAWELVERLLRNPEIELDLLRQAQAQQKEVHSDAVMNLEQIETVRAKYHTELKSLYQDYKARLITREIYEEEKAELDQRLQLAEELHAEYKQNADQKILSDGAIKRISAECRKFADYLDQAGTLTYEQKRTLIELFDIRGEFKVEDGYLVLYLSIHELEFEKLTVRENQGS